jgi:hypothetical protein
VGRRWIGIACLIALLLYPATSRSATGVAPADAAAGLEQHPLAGAEPVRIQMGLYVTDLAMVDEADEAFEIQGYLYATWKDDRLIDKTALSVAKSRRLDPGAVWNPQLDIENLRSFKTFRQDFFCFPDGTVYWEERFDAILSAEYYLRRFPFDHQSLLVIVQPAISPARPTHSLVEFAPTDYATGLGAETYLAAWDIEGIRYFARIGHTNAAGLDAPRADFEITISRRAGFYIWKVFLPILLMTMVSWTTFWVKADEFDWQMKIPMTTLLAMIAFEFAIARDLPRVSYLTVLDVVFLTSFVFAFLAIIEAITVHIVVLRREKARAEWIHYNARWVVPLAYFLILGILIPMFFIGAGRPVSPSPQVSVAPL